MNQKKILKQLDEAVSIAQELLDYARQEVADHPERAEDMQPMIDHALQVIESRNEYVALLNTQDEQ